jgi:energy-coupling factor transport system permease protein
VIYRRRASPLHAARAAAAIAWCAALAVAVILESNPFVLGVVTLVILSAGPLAGVGPQLVRVLLWAIPLALTICLINALVTRDGLTVIWRLGDVPILGQTNITLEATAYGGVLGLRAIALMLLGGLYSLAVDPDDVLRLFRRVSFSSALSAAVATRMIPVLLRDSRRLADAQRCRPGDPPGRVQLLRATTSGVLDRALDVAAALEVRGYGAARQRARGRHHQAWSRHDLAFAGSAAAVLLLAVLSRALGWSTFHAYPVLRAPVGAGTVFVSVGLAVAALAPFADHRGIVR